MLKMARDGKYCTVDKSQIESMEKHGWVLVGIKTAVDFEKEAKRAAEVAQYLAKEAEAKAKAARAAEENAKKVEDQKVAEPKTEEYADKPKVEEPEAEEPEAEETPKPTRRKIKSKQ